eukprot:3050983-Rhodomonas_salina.8
MMLTDRTEVSENKACRVDGDGGQPEAKEAQTATLGLLGRGAEQPTHVERDQVDAISRQEEMMQRVEHILVTSKRAESVPVEKSRFQTLRLLLCDVSACVDSKMQEKRCAATWHAEANELHLASEVPHRQLQRLFVLENTLLSAGHAVT